MLQPQTSTSFLHHFKTKLKNSKIIRFFKVPHNFLEAIGRTDFLMKLFVLSSGQHRASLLSSLYRPSRKILFCLRIDTNCAAHLIPKNNCSSKILRISVVCLNFHSSSVITMSPENSCLIAQFGPISVNERKVKFWLDNLKYQNVLLKYIPKIPTKKFMCNKCKHSIQNKNYTSSDHF